MRSDISETIHRKTTAKTMTNGRAIGGVIRSRMAVERCSRVRIDKPTLIRHLTKVVSDG